MALEQHAIPTEVTNYKFRLVGDMTLEQFAWLAGGIMIAILMYAAKFIPFFIRYPIMVIFPILGAAIAFVPYEGRGLDRWIIAFIKAIYAPTEFIWHKESFIPAYLQANRPVNLATPSTTKQLNVTPTQVQDYLQTLTYERNSSASDQLEANRLAVISSLLDPSVSVTPTIISSSPIPLDPNAPDPRLDPNSQVLSANSEPEPSPIEASPIKTTTPATPSTVPQTPATPPPLQGAEEPPLDPTLVQVMSVPNPLNSETFTSDILTTPINSFTSRHLPPNPTMTNILSGVVVDDQDNPITNAIVEISTPDNQPIRALKTNPYGQFAIATPLNPGSYIVSVEKDNQPLCSSQIDVANQIIPSITLVAQSQSLPS